MDHSRPSSVFESRLNGLDQGALRRVALAISAMLLNEQSLLTIEREVRSELEAFGGGETVSDKALLFWRTARIVQNRELAPAAHATGLFVPAVWNLLTQANVRTTTGHSTLADMAREAERARIEREAAQRRRFTGTKRSKVDKADLAGDVGEGLAESLLSHRSSNSGSSGGFSSSSSSRGGGFDFDPDCCCSDGLFSLVTATIKHRRFMR